MILRSRESRESKPDRTGEESLSARAPGIACSSTVVMSTGSSANSSYVIEHSRSGARRSAPGYLVVLDSPVTIPRRRGKSAIYVTKAVNGRFKHVARLNRGGFASVPAPRDALN